MVQTAITQRRLKEVLSYDSEKGIFIWTQPTKYHPRMLGQEAGCRSTGYIMIRIDGSKYKAHRLAWLYVYGKMPKQGIDHIDGNPFNNGISNLRQSSQAQNGANAKLRKGKLLPKGVRLNGRRYTARISFNKVLINIGSFATPEEASAAYFLKSQELYGVFARVG